MESKEFVTREEFEQFKKETQNLALTIREALSGNPLIQELVDRAIFTRLTGTNPAEYDRQMKSFLATKLAEVGNRLSTIAVNECKTIEKQIKEQMETHKIEFMKELRSL